MNQEMSQRIQGHSGSKKSRVFSHPTTTTQGQRIKPPLRKNLWIIDVAICEKLNVDLSTSIELFHI